MTTTDRLAFWLMPGARARESFATIIGELALRLDAPVFEPHVTLLGAIPNDDKTRRVFRDLIIAPNYELEIDGIHFSRRYTQTLFVRFRLSEELRELCRALGQTLDLEIADDFDPHLSLLYKEMPLLQLEELARSIRVPFQRASFAGLKLIAHPPTITRRDDVQAFREIDRRS
jgi:2'-5' RNA ligase